MAPRFSHALDRRCFAPSIRVLGRFVIMTSGFCYTPANMPGIGLLPCLDVLNKLLAMESEGFPQKTPFPFMFSWRENFAFSPVVMFLATS